MRILLLIALLSTPSSALAADAPRRQLPEPYATLARLNDCARERAAAFAVLDGTISEIVLAAMSACGELQHDLDKAYRDYYAKQGLADELAIKNARAIAADFVREAQKSLYGIVAEARLSRS